MGDKIEDANLDLNHTTMDTDNVTNNNNSPTQENNIFYSLPEPPPYKRYKYLAWDILVLF